ncbi:hypothetical protein FA15DRAFT_60912 [Coprinopsis marcescibilis]|uniref:Protein ZIP4 homolog n=1 Tax=Coprinopsis marcescibilis TaxID=230819 RepID=A0A5C3L6N3_COPMA|nr:hypothetical protein FA15DRAFT_60912 [Coprinopsis marcescibilis]
MSSGRKIRGAGNAQEAFESIMELLSRIKPKLQGSLKSPHEGVTEDLLSVSSLAERFLELRLKAGKALANLTDTLDQEGVNLWNLSSVVKGESDEGRVQLSTIRYAAFRLVEAGLERKPPLETLLNVLQMASKTGISLSEARKNVVAGSVLTSAAKYEEMLRNIEPSEVSQQKLIASATVMYFCSRMEVAWNEENRTLAEFMSKKIAEDSERLSLLTIQLRKYLALKVHDIGRSLLGDAGKQALDAVEWLQRSFALLDKLPDDDSAAAIPELKVSMLRTLARAYFLSDSYDRAEAVLDELMQLPGNDAKPEFQELRWLRLTVLKRRKAPEVAIIDALKAIIDYTTWSEANITEILQELRAFSHHRILLAEVHKYCIHHAVQQKENEEHYADRFTLSMIFHCSKDENHSRGIQTLNDVFTLLSETDVDFGRAAITACLSLLWQTGGRYYKAKKRAQAADWFLVGSHQFFKKNSPSTAAKCFRKAALCYLEQKEYSKASTIIRRCSLNEARTQYIIFLTAFHQGLEEEAICAIKAIQAAPDFDRTMLLLATQISHRSELKRILLAVLEGLLKSLKLGSSGEIVVEAMALLRCIIRVILGLLVDPLANRSALIDTLVSHFRTAKILVLSALEQKAVSLIHKDISWLWRTAYNCAVQGCSEWEGCGEQISELFDTSRILLETCWNSSPVDIDNESCVYLLNAIFSAVAGRVFSTREMINTTGKLDVPELRKILERIREAKSAILGVLSRKNASSGGSNGDRGEQLLQTLRIFEMEALIQVKEWDKVSGILQEVLKPGSTPVGTYEAFADLLWVAPDCPVQVLHECLEAILNASLECKSLSLERFSRWLRAICTIVLARNSPQDRTKAFGYFEQAVGTIQEYADYSGSAEQTYPMDERQWLLATSYNTATECLHASLIDEAKRWFEIAISICRFVPGGRERSEKISDTYRHLLSRYGKA